ncbi:MAG: nicotinamide mononucleotide transporter, partial [Nitrospinae bacterium]|nr:nicotinamide mononucleotide transporter [Nitrospinota bacterium]
ITVDVISVAMYLVKNLYMTTALYAVFLALAASGFLAWRNSLLKPERG